MTRLEGEEAASRVARIIALQQNTAAGQQNTSDLPVTMPSLLLALPGEIRNRIYDQVFEFMAVMVQIDRDASGRLDADSDITKYTFLGFTSDPRTMFERKSGRNRTAPLKVCSKMYKETLQLLYARTGFCFINAKKLQEFIYRTSKTGLAAIEYLGMCQPRYEHGTYVNDLYWKEEYEKAWVWAYYLVGQNMTGLQQIALELELPFRPLRLGTEQLWAAAARMIGTHKFVDAAVNVTNRYCHPEIGREAAKQLEDALLATPRARVDWATIPERNYVSSYRFEMFHKLALVCLGTSETVRLNRDFNIESLINEGLEWKGVGPFEYPLMPESFRVLTELRKDYCSSRAKYGTVLS